MSGERVGERPPGLRANSRPILPKRLVADGFDTGLIFLLFMLFTALIMETPLGADYRRRYEDYRQMEQEALTHFEGDLREAAAALNQNEAYQTKRLEANIRAYLLKALACFLAQLPLLLIFPLLNRDRATPGKRLTGLMLFSEARQSRARGSGILGRFLYVFLLDSLALYLLTGILTFLLVPVIRLTEMLLNSKHKTLCDAVTGLMVIEKLSYEGIN